MKYVMLVIATLALAACNEKENQGVHKGTFEADCTAKNGTLAQTATNEYTCTLPDGTVLSTVDKKETGASK